MVPTILAPLLAVLPKLPAILANLGARHADHRGQDLALPRDLVPPVATPERPEVVTHLANAIQRPGLARRVAAVVLEIAPVVAPLARVAPRIAAVTLELPPERLMGLTGDDT